MPAGSKFYCRLVFRAGLFATHVYTSYSMHKSRLALLSRLKTPALWSSKPSCHYRQCIVYSSAVVQATGQEATFATPISREAHQGCERHNTIVGLQLLCRQNVAHSSSAAVDLVGKPPCQDKLMHSHAQKQGCMHHGDWGRTAFVLLGHIQRHALLNLVTNERQYICRCTWSWHMGCK